MQRWGWWELGVFWCRCTRSHRDVLPYNPITYSLYTLRDCCYFGELKKKNDNENRERGNISSRGFAPAVNFPRESHADGSGWPQPAGLRDKSNGLMSRTLEIISPSFEAACC